MTVSVLKPRQTAIFENEQKSRLSPESVDAGTLFEALYGSTPFSADTDEVLDSGITLYNNGGMALYALRVVNEGVVDDDAYTLLNDGVVNPPSQLAAVLTEATIQSQIY